jgi:hypothetical protein
MSDPLPAFGNLKGKVLQAQPVSIHGDIYYDLIIEIMEIMEIMELDGQTERGVKLRVPNHLCERPPAPGDCLTLNFLLQQVDSVAFDEATS